MALTIFVSGMVSGQQPSAADSVNFTVKIKPDTAAIGDEITVIVEVDYPKDLQLSQPSVNTAQSGFAVKGDPKIKTKTRGERKYDRYTFTLAAFKKGEQELPVIEFFYYDKDGKQNSRIAPIETVYIKSILPADTGGLEIKDIVGPKSLPILWWPYAVGAAVIIILTLGIWYFIRRKARLQAVPETPPEPPFEAAIRKLNELRFKNLPNVGRYKQFYIELSEIIRYYIDGRFEIPAVECTTFELKRIFKHAELTEDQIKSVLDFLSYADRVKFAKHLPSPFDCERDFQLIKKFVVDTKPVVLQPEAAEVTA